MKKNIKIVLFAFLTMLTSYAIALGLTIPIYLFIRVAGLDTVGDSLIFQIGLSIVECCTCILVIEAMWKRFWFKKKKRKEALN